MADYVATARFPFRPLSYEYKQQAVAKELIIDYAAGKGDLYVCDVTGTLLKVSDIIVSRSLDNVKDNIKVTIDGTSYKIEAGLAKIVDKIKNNETRLSSVDKIFTIPVNSSGVPTGAKPTSFAEEVIPSSAIKFDPNATDPYLPAKMVTGTLSNATIAAAKVTGLATVATSGSYNDLSNKPSIPVAGNTTTAVAAADSNTQGTATTWARSDHNHHLPTSGVTAGTKGPTAAVDGVEAATINVPKITVDKYGRVTALDHYQYTSRNTTYGYASTSTAGLVKVGDTLAIASGILNQKSGVVTAGTIGPDQTAATTLAFSGKFKVPKITYDAYGRVTGTSTIEFTLPANPDTDVKVTQTVKSDDADRPFILVPTATQNATTTTTSVFATGATLNAKTKKISLTYAGETGLTVNNTNKEHQVDFIVGSSGKGGVYDRTNAKWVVYSDIDGTIGLGTGTNDSVTVGGNVTLGGSTNTVTVPGTLSTNKLNITDSINLPSTINAQKIVLSGSNESINLGRTDGVNYIKTPSTGGLAVCPTDGSITITGSPLVVKATDVSPGKTDTFSLGTDSHKWSNVYATTFHGNLTGNVTGTASGNIVLPLAYSTSTNTDTVTHYITTDITVASGATTVIHGYIEGTHGLGSGAGTFVRFQAYWKKETSTANATLSTAYYYDPLNTLKELSFHIGSNNTVYISFIPVTTYHYLRIFVYKGTNAGTINNAISCSTTSPGTFSANKAATLVRGTTMTGASASAAGTAGLVPAPAAGKNTSFLRGDGTWASISVSTTDEKVKANLITATTTSYYLLGKSGTTTSTGEAYFDTTAYVNGSTLYSKSLNINNGKVTISDTGQIMGNGFTLNLLGSGVSNINSITSSSIKTDLINTNSADGLILEDVKKINNVEIPSNPKFTDINVTQTVKSDNKSYPLLLAPNGQTTTATTTANFSIKASVNASTGVITVGGLDAGTGAISGASLTTTGAITGKSLTIKNGNTTYASISATGAIKGHSISTAYTNDSNETVYGAITAGDVTVKGKLSVDATSGSISGLLKYFTASIPIGTDSSWTGSGPYTCTISITGLLATDHAVLDLVASTTYATAKSQEEAYSQIYKAQVSAADTLKVWAHAKPSVAIPINLGVVR